MGDKSLMKKISIISLLSLFMLSNSDAKPILEASQIASMVSAIKMERLGTDAVTLEHTPSPFRIPPQVKKVITPKATQSVGTLPLSTTPALAGSTIVPVVKKVVVMKLEGISNNTAFINGKWYRVGMNVEGYSVVSISKSSVMLKNKNGIKQLSISKINPLQ